MSAPHRKKLSISNVITASVALQAVFSAAVLVQANPAVGHEGEENIAYGLSGHIGLAMVSTATYEGSPNTRAIVVPDVYHRYRSRDWGTFELGAGGLTWQTHSSNALRFGLLLGYDAGRKTRKPSAGDPTPSDERLLGMGNVKASPEVGVLVGSGPISLVARKSAGSRGHRGTQVDLGISLPYALTNSLGFALGGGVTWADKHYMQAYFGVTPAQSQSSGFLAYSPSAGIRRVEASLSTEYTFAKDWKLGGKLAVSTLGGSARDSPLVDRKPLTTAVVGFAYVF